MAHEVEGPLSASELAQRAGLTAPGAQKALGRLVRSGFVLRVGGGRSRQYEIRRSDPLMSHIIALFKAEQDRFERLGAKLRQAVARLSPPPHAAWVRSAPQRLDDPLTVGLLHESGQLAQAKEQLRAELDGIEREFDLIIDLESYTKAEIADLKIGDAQFLYGFSPSEDHPPVKAQQPITHDEKDRRQKRLSCGLAAAVEQDPSLVKRAKAHLDRLLEENQGAAAGDLKEWRGILEIYPLHRLLRFLESSGERAERLRQSNPFFAVLTLEEQARLEDET
jgi:DNA-binding Lrp family transcriptional regulator